MLRILFLVKQGIFVIFCLRQKPLHYPSFLSEELNKRLKDHKTLQNRTSRHPYIKPITKRLHKAFWNFQGILLN